MRGEVHWVGQGSPRWQDRRNWSRVSGGLPGAFPPGRGEVAVLDAGSGDGDVDLFGMVCSLRVKGFGGVLVTPTGQTIRFRPDEAEQPARAARAAFTPRLPRAVAERLRDLEISWRDAVRSGMATLAGAGRRWTVTPQVAGGTSITAAAGGGNWTAGGTWVGGNAPTAADDALLTNTSGNVTINSGALCRSLNCTGYTGVLTHTAAVTLTIGDGTAGAGNVALKLVAGMTYTLGDAATSAIAFASTSATVQTVTSGTKSLGNTTFGSGASAGSWQLSDAFAIGVTGLLTVTRGTLDTNGKTVNVGAFNSNNSNTRTLTFGASLITITAAGASAWNTGNLANITVTPSSATVTLSGAGATFLTATTSVWATLSVVLTGSGDCYISGNTGNVTVANYTRTGTASKLDGLAVGPSGGSITATGTCTLGGNSVQGANRLFVRSLITGSQRTLIAGAYVITGDVDFEDVNLAYTGGASWTNAGAAFIGDALGNAGAVTTNANASVPQTFVGGTANWSAAGSWTSRAPLPQDDVIVNTTTAGTLTCDMSRLGRDHNFTGFTRTLSVTLAVTSYGSVTFASGMAYGATSGWTLSGRGLQTITCAGKGFPTSVTLTAPGGTYTFLDAFLTSNTSAVITQSAGTLNSNNQTVSIGAYTESNSIAAVRSLIMGTSVWSLTRPGAFVVWQVASLTNYTLSAASATISVTSTDATVKSFTGGAQSYGTVNCTSAGSGGFTITDSGNTFATLDLECTTARTITLPAGGVQTVTTALILKGAAGQLLSLVSSTPGTATTISAVCPATTTTQFISPSADVAILMCVSNTVTMPYMASLGLARTRDLPYEAQFPLARTRDLAYETQLGLAATVSDPYEILTSLAASTVLPYEAASSPTATATLPYEAAHGFERARTLPYEAVVPASATVTAPYEVTLGVEATASLPYVASGSAAGIAPMPYESRGLASQTVTGPYEVNYGVRNTATLPYEDTGPPPRGYSTGFVTILGYTKGAVTLG